MSDQRAGGIGWTDETWNPVRGCSRVSPGCENCYAERVAARFSDPGQAYEGLATMRTKERTVRRDFKDGSVELRTLHSADPRWTGTVRLVPEHLADPLRWKRPRKIFVNSMSDLFHERLSNEEIAAVFGVMAASERHTFQVLTKRPERMRDWFRWAPRFAEEQRAVAACPNVFRAMLDAVYEYGGGLALKPLLDKAWEDAERDPWPLPNVWLGVSVEDRKRLSRLDELREVPAAVRFISAEPLLEDLGPVDLRGISWVIAGCESGPGARPMDETWVRSLRDQCVAAGTAFFYKQAMREGRLVKEPWLDGRQHLDFPA